MKKHPSTARVDIDLQRRSGRPLSKERLSVYNSGLVPIERYRRDAHFFDESGAESLRIDLGWGAEWMPWKQQPVTIAADGTVEYHFEETDELVDLLADTNTRPYWSYCYVPIAARPTGGDWRTIGESDAVWVDMVAAYVAHARERGSAIGYHEVYNEPDLRDERTAEPVFYSGDLDDYLALYRDTSRAIRAADPWAVVGGPALAFPLANGQWLDRFLELVVREGLPLDFLSFHHYGTFSVEGSLDVVDRALESYDLPYLETHLNEYNSFPIDYPEGGTQDTHLLAAAFAADIPRLLDRPGLTKTSWAQFLDSGEGNFSGMVRIGGSPKPLYEVYEFYQRMPLARRSVSIDGPDGLGALASSDESGAAVLAWNRHFADLEVEFVLDGYAHSEVRIRTIGAGGTTESVHEVVVGRVSLTIPTAGVALIEGGDLGRPPRERIVERALRRRTASAGDWVDVDEASGTLQFGVESADAVLVCGADFAEGATPSGWEWAIRDALGGKRPGALAVREIDSSGVRDSMFGDAAAPAVEWNALAPSAPARDGRVRVLAALIGSEPGTFAMLRPTKR
jgi:xylan 1,4-beta-xylosidase